MNRAKPSDFLKVHVNNMPPEKPDIVEGMLWIEKIGDGEEVWWTWKGNKWEYVQTDIPRVDDQC